MSAITAFDAKEFKRANKTGIQTIKIKSKTTLIITLFRVRWQMMPVWNHSQ